MQTMVDVDKENELTAEELEGVKALAKLCHAEGIPLPTVRKLAEYVIIEHLEVDKAFARLKRVRAVEEEYRLHEIPFESALEYIRQNVPEYRQIGGIYHDEKDGANRRVMVQALERRRTGFLNPTKNPEGFRMFLRYSTYEPMCPTIQDMRDGIVLVADYRKFSLKEFDREFERKVGKLFSNNVPVRIKKVFVVLPQSAQFTIARKLWNVMKFLLPRKFQERVHLVQMAQLFKLVDKSILNKAVFEEGEIVDDNTTTLNQRREVFRKSIAQLEKAYAHLLLK